MNFKIHFLSSFREFFVFHHASLEFRAKVFAAMLLGKKPENITDDDFENLKKIGSEVYPTDEKRVDILITTVKEYINKVIDYKNFTLDSLLMDIDRTLKEHRRYYKKIDFSHLRRLISDDEDDALIQQRVYEFLVNEVKIYSH